MRRTDTLSTKFCFATLVLILSLHCCLSNAFSIDISCNRFSIDGIRSSAEEALNIAAYASWRIDHTVDENLSKAFAKLLGPNNKNLFAARMDEVVTKVGKYIGEWSEDTRDSGPLITCGLDHLKETDEFGVWRDLRLPGTFIRSKTNILCDGNAFEYSTGNEDGEGPKSVIVLCDGAAPGSAALDNQYTIGAEWRTKNWKVVQWKNLCGFMSETLLHEYLHFINPNIVDPASSYDFDSLAALSPNEKIHNAETYASLAFAMYMRTYTISENGDFLPLDPKYMPGPGPHASM